MINKRLGIKSAAEILQQHFLVLNKLVCREEKNKKIIQLKRGLLILTLFQKMLSCYT